MQKFSLVFNSDARSVRNYPVFVFVFVFVRECTGGFIYKIEEFALVNINVNKMKLPVENMFRVNSWQRME